ncbi:MAG: ATP-grasp domain-containing protein [Deltaproteobacteria bacterium]|nr:ATP-grasp domain-containing protein [Deltaproteobacteria bacterium]
MSFPTVMVLDGETRASLSIVRSLGQRGVPIVVGCNHPLGRSKFSRYAKEHFVYPKDGPLTAIHSTIVEQVKRLRPDILMPVFDQSWEVVNSFYEEYTNLTAMVPNPGLKTSETLSDKGSLADWAEKYGVPIPKTYRPSTLKDALTLNSSLPYPVLLKPKRNTAGVGIQRVNNPKEFMEALRGTNDLPVIQEYIEGEDLELTLLSVYGESIAGSAYMSLRNSPLPYGPPIACRTIKDETIMAIGREFLKKIGYHGVAHLDFRRDRRDGTPKLLDFNARIAGTNEISIRSGIDFAFMQYQIATGEKVEPCFDYKAGVEFRWYLPGELRHFLHTPYKLKTLQNHLKWQNVFTDISFADPLPHAVIVVEGAYRLAKKLKQKIEAKVSFKCKNGSS